MLGFIFCRVGIVFLIIILSAPPGLTAGKGEVTLPQTGQMSWYYNGDDGDLHRGVYWFDWGAQRFVYNGDGTLSDMLTGLMWLKYANCIKSFYSNFDQDGVVGDGAVTWQHALDFVQAVNNGTYSLCSAGYNDWRLPNVNELESLFHAEKDGIRWLRDELGFVEVGKPYFYDYWTSTTFSPDNTRAWYVNVQNGKALDKYKSDYAFVLLVRGKSTPPAQLWRTGQVVSFYSGDDGALKEGAPWPSYNRFRDNGDGTVTDYLTGLMWLKDANCMRTYYPSYDTTGAHGDGAVTWQQALDFVAGINSGTFSQCGAGYQDWRLPNRKELRSLLDYSQMRPPLPSGHPFINTLPSLYPYPPYWTSSTVPDGLGNAWTISTYYYGEMDIVAKTSVGFVWPVRGGVIDLFLSAKGENSSTIFLRKRTQTGWENWQIVSGETSDSPFITSCQGILWLAVKGASGNGIYVRATDGTGRWSEWLNMGGQTTVAPSATCFNGFLYLFVRGIDGGIYYRTYLRDGMWTSWQRVPAGTTSHSPAVTTFSGKLWLFVKGSSGNGIYYTSMDTSGAWDSWKIKSGATDSTPAVAAYAGSLLLVVKGAGNTGIYVTSTRDGTSWQPWAILDGATSSFPVLSVYDSKLYLSVRGTNNGIYWRNLDRLEWKSWNVVTGKTDRAPGISGY